MDKIKAEQRFGESARMVADLAGRQNERVTCRPQACYKIDGDMGHATVATVLHNVGRRRNENRSSTYKLQY